MRRLPALMLSCTALFAIAACSSTAANNGTGTSDGTDAAGSDAQVPADVAQKDVTPGTDGKANDTGAKDTGPVDTGTLDAGGTDAGGTDAGGTDAEGTDATGGTDVVDEKASGTDAAVLDAEDAVISDAAVVDADADLDADVDFDADVDLDADVSTVDGGDFDIDIFVPDVPPGSCTTDTDCVALSFSPCQIGYCASGMCKVKPAADGVACTVGGSCGGPGVCKKGGCDAPSTCQPDICSPVTLDCGTKVVIDLGSLGASKFSGYGSCSSTKWNGPEAAVLLSNATTVTASLSLDSTGVTTDVQLFDIAPTYDGKCDTVACDDSSYYSLTLGLPANMPRIVILDTAGADTGTITLTLDCTVVTSCGDGTCDPGELCSTCAKDCGTCTNTTCGNGTCDATENCITCEGDCGKCVAGCMETSAATCKGCACESCVCAQDSWCCTGAWDSACVGECGTCGTTCPTFNDVCGDGICGQSEYSTSCPNDCTGYQYCGDGTCSPASNEDCKGCPQDCGFCMLPGAATVGCGDGKCSGDETCANCTADCGVCGDYSCACLADPTCCTDQFSFSCQDACSTCVVNNGGGSCPISTCGDGICAGETCNSCPQDCKDGCTYGCQGKCGKKSMASDGTTCWCDSYCSSAGDCCSDKAALCGP